MRTNGFSMVELMMAVAVMGLVAVVAAPSVLRSNQQAQRDESLALMTTRLVEARQTAMRQRAPVELEFNDAAQTLRVWSDLNRNGSVDAGEQETFSLPGSSGVAWTLPSTVGRFNSKGQFQAPGGYWRIAAKPPDASDVYLYLFPSGQHLQTAEYH